MAPKPACRIKICGITRAEDALYACELGVWALGFIFYKQSPRYVSPEQVGNILKVLQSRGLTPPLCVGVFVNPTHAFIDQTATIAGINAVQLHGEESIEFCKALTLPGIKAFRLGDQQQLPPAADYAKVVDYMLVDAYHKESYGGTGKLVDWSLAASLLHHGNLILAGGITPDNIWEAITTVRPYAIDLSSGVEESPGIKSRALMAKLFSQVG